MVETVSGQDLEAYMRENIFAPLGMRDTGFVPNAEQFARYAAGACPQSRRIA